MKSSLTSLPDKPYLIATCNDNNHLILSNLIGEGGIKKAYPVINLTNGRCTCVTVCGNEKNHLPQDIFDKLCKLSSQNTNGGGVLPLEGMMNDKHKQYIFQKLCLGDLYDYIVHSKNPLTNDQKKDFGNDLFESLVFLHDAGLLHRDIKPENVLIDKRAYLSDFDRTSPCKSGNVKVGDVSYLPSEVLVDGDMSEYDQKSEVWSLGLVLYTLITGQKPYMVTRIQEIEKIALSKDIEKFEYDQSRDFLLQLPWDIIPEEEETEVTKLLSKMMCEDRNERCSLKEAWEMFKKIPAKDLHFIPPDMLKLDQYKPTDLDYSIS